MIWFKQLWRYTTKVQPFNFAKNKQRIEVEINKRIKVAGLTDKDGFTLIEGIIIPVSAQLLEEVTPLGGKLFPQIAIFGNSSGLIYYFYLDSLFPGEGLD